MNYFSYFKQFGQGVVYALQGKASSQNSHPQDVTLLHDPAPLFDTRTKTIEHLVEPKKRGRLTRLFDL